MVIYNNEPFVKLLIILLTAGAIGMIAVLVYVGIIIPIKSDMKKTYLIYRILYHVLPCVLIGIVLAFFLSEDVQWISYRSNMKQGNGETMYGESLLVSTDIFEYRGDFLGYQIVLSDGEKQVEFCNTFTDEKVLGALNAGLNLKVYYGYVGDSPYIWCVELIGE